MTAGALAEATAPSRVGRPEAVAGEVLGARDVDREPGRDEELEVGLVVLVDGSGGSRRPRCGAEAGEDGGGREGVLEVDAGHGLRLSGWSRRSTPCRWSPG